MFAFNLFQLNIMSFNPLMTILNQNKLNGPNYLDWKRNLDIVLVADEYKFVLTTPTPAPLSTESTEEQREAHRKWHKANEMARCYILASMSNVLQQQHHNMPTAAEMMLSLKDLFGEQDRSARFEAMRKIMSTSMPEGASVREHVLRMMEYLNEIEVLGGFIDGDTKIDIILHSLPRSYENFRLNVIMSKKGYTLAELLTDLVAAEGLMGKGPQAHISARAGPSSSSGGKKKKPVKKMSSGGGGNSGSKQVAPSGGVKKPKGKCFRCNKTGHWKSDCPLLKGKNGKSLALVFETCFVTCSTSSWVVDTGATDHVCCNLQWFLQTRQLSEDEISISLGDATKVAAVAVGDVHLSFSDSVLVLKNVLYVPSFRKNLISVSKLYNDGYSVIFNDNVVIMRNNSYICSGTLVNNLYTLTCAHQIKSQANTSTSLNKRKDPSQLNQTYLWHLRLGHVNLRRIQRLVSSGSLESLQVEPFPVCESCLEGKMTSRPFKAKGNRANDVLELIHSDLCGPMSIQAKGGFEYFVTFIDDYSRFGYIYLMRHKSECFDKFKEFKAEVENHQGKSIKSLRSDRGGEYLSNEFRQYLLENGITSQLTAPGTPQQNGVAERRNRSLLEMVRSMMSFAELPTSFWGYALETAAYLLNFLPSKSVPKTPKELWSGRKPSMNHIRVWGCPAHVLDRGADKLASRTEVRLFVGYPKGTRGGYFYSPKDQRVVVSTNARFLEEDYISEHKPKSEIILNELRGDNGIPSVQEDIPQITAQRVDSEIPTRELPRRSGRVIHIPERFMFVGESSDLVTTREHESDPWTYKEAIQDVDADSWQRAMDSEIESINAMKVYDLRDIPDGKKAIGCKWIYRRKRGSDGKVITFKARLVAKGFTQKEGIDYDETFSPVAMLKSIRILLFIANHMDYEVWQMDVKTAFLNGNLDEDIYMQQPEGYVKKGQEHRVWKLNKSLYGLKQASRSWNIRFDEVIKSYGFEQCQDESCVYKKSNGNVVVFLVLYVDDILLIGNNVKVLSDVKVWLSEQFQMKDLGEASYILGIKVIRDRKKRMLCLSQATYIDTVIARFNMQNSKKGLLPFRHGVPLSKDMCPKTQKEIEEMAKVPYASAVGSLMYAMLCTRPDICYAVGMVARYQSNPGQGHWTAVKHILKYLKRTRDYMLVYQSDSLIPLGYTDSDFQADRDERKSTSGYVFTLGGGAISWRSVKQKCIADSTMEAEYVAASEAAKEAVWLRSFLLDLGVSRSMPSSITIYCDNAGAVANSKEPRAHKASKHIERKYHVIREIVKRGDITVTKIASLDNLADPLTKTLPTKIFEKHVEGLGLRCVAATL